MTYAFEDTCAEAFEVQLEGYRLMSGQQRLSQAMAMTRLVRQMAFSALRRQHPDWTEDQIRMAFIDLVYGSSVGEMVRNCRRTRGVQD